MTLQLLTEIMAMFCDNAPDDLEYHSGNLTTKSYLKWEYDIIQIKVQSKTFPIITECAPTEQLEIISDSNKYYDLLKRLREFNSSDRMVLIDHLNSLMDDFKCDKDK